MPKQYEAKTLEEAYEKASKSLNCSIVDLHIEVIQSPSKGLLGLFAKKAIISAKVKNKPYPPYPKDKKPNHEPKGVKVETLQTKLDQINENEKEKKRPSGEVSGQIKKEKIFEDFYSSEEEPVESKIRIKKDKQQLVDEIHEKINDLFSKLCYEIDEIKVDIYDDQTVYVEFNGEDSALLIGKEGYRYKALSYILFNWINEKYGMMLRLEVAQFLENQEEAIHNYLIPVIETIKEEGFYKTKPLDGILVHIALSKLRDEFPDKYVAVKTNPRGEKYILVNEYRN